MTDELLDVIRRKDLGKFTRWRAELLNETVNALACGCGSALTRRLEAARILISKEERVFAEKTWSVKIPIFTTH